MARALVVVASGIAAALGCGPSIQSIHEGSVRFEHCYRLDLDPKIAPAHRHACWKQWLEVYSFGQSRDRMEHARKRANDLESGDPNPPSLNLEKYEEREERQFYMSTPGPTNVHAPPPPVATPAVPEASAPGDACVGACRTTFAACETRCKENEPDPIDPKTQPPPKPADAGPTKEGEGKESATSVCTCDADYKSCAARCFE